MSNDDLYDCIIGKEVEPEDLDFAFNWPGSAEEDHARETEEFLALPTDGGMQ